SPNQVQGQAYQLTASVGLMCHMHPLVITTGALRGWRRLQQKRRGERRKIFSSLFARVCQSRSALSRAPITAVCELACLAERLLTFQFGVPVLVSITIY